MSEDWQVGDLALCVDAGEPYGGLVEGRTYGVIGLRSDGEDTFLFVGGGVNHRGYYSWRFRKIRPDEPKACEEEFKILLQLSKPRVSAYMMGGKR